jgi:hypothetical protein
MAKISVFQEKTYLHQKSYETLQTFGAGVHNDQQLHH